MIDKIEIWSMFSSRPLRTFQISGAGLASPYQIRNVDGLDPVKADIRMDSLAGNDGSFFRGARTGVRNLIFTIALKPYTESAMTLRESLMSIFQLRSEIQIRFHTTEGNVRITTGHVESFEYDNFTQDPVATISVICSNPYFYSEPKITKDGKTNTQLDISGTTQAPTPIVLTIDVPVVPKSFSVWASRRNLIFLGDGMKVGDKITLNTTPGAKTLSRKGSDGRSELYLNYINKGGLDLYLGDVSTNTFLVNSNVDANYTLEYTPRFFGV